MTAFKALRLVATLLALTIGRVEPCLATGKPVLIELFTSEGCSSCPPADSYLSSLRRSNKNVILLGEHVDYWNNLGWTDPFSSSKWSERQRDYCQKLGANSWYTPQAVINGERECVGSNSLAVQEAINSTAGALTVPIVLKLAKGAADSLNVSVFVGNSSRTNNVSLYLVEDNVSVNVKSGENGGRLLKHDGVVRSQTSIKDIQSGKSVTATLPLKNYEHTENCRVVAVLEDSEGPFGATEQALSTK